MSFIWQKVISSPLIIFVAMTVTSVITNTDKAPANIIDESAIIASPQQIDIPEKSLDASGLLSLESGASNTELSGATIPNAQPSDTLQQLDMLDDSASTEVDEAMSQVTNVSQLRDVRPTDWAYEALRSLVERYGCIAGYPDGTFRGNRALTRYEFAAGLNACLRQMEKLIAASTSDVATKTDLEQLRRLTQEFQAELATLGTRVDKLESRTAFLETHQFSTTTKLTGEAIFAISDSFGGKNASDFLSFPANLDQSNTVFQDRIRIGFLTSFTGKDRLRVRLQASNAEPIFGFATNPESILTLSNEGRFNFDDTNREALNNRVYLDLLDYSFPIGDQLRVNIFASSRTAGAGGGFHYHYAETFNPYLEDYGGGNGALSFFGERNPIYTIGGGAAGIGLNFRPNNIFRLDLGYLAQRASGDLAPFAGNGTGLFNGEYSALAQLVVQPTNNFKFGLTYVNAYSAPNRFRFGSHTSNTGTFFANLLSLALEPVTGQPPLSLLLPSVTNSYGFEASYKVSPKFAISGWLGYTWGRIIGFGDAQIWNYALTLAFPDLGKPGNLAGIIIGSEPTLKSIQSGNRVLKPEAGRVFDTDDALHFEALYRYKFTDNISVTPGLIWLPAINQRNENDDVFIGTIRTTFTF